MRYSHSDVGLDGEEFYWEVSGFIKVSSEPLTGSLRRYYHNDLFCFFRASAWGPSAIVRYPAVPGDPW
jgi:hypothetical protein